jgi:hypothetical protein
VEQERLDRFAVALARGVARRRVLATAVGLAAGAGVTLLTGDEAVARRRRLNAVCRANKECASGLCRKKRCDCPPDQERCGDVCCGAGAYCCNPLSSTCAPLGGGCGGDGGGCHD